MSGGFSPQRLEHITQTNKTRYVDTGLIPGALTLVWRQGRIRHLGLSGAIDIARGKAMRADAVFRIYSMTKPVTAVALLMLLEEAKLGLDDPVHRFIPGFEQSAALLPAAIWPRAFVDPALAPADERSWT